MFWNSLCSIYLVIFGAYWMYNLAHLFFDVRTAADIRHFTTNKLGLSERQLQTVTWPEVANRIVLVRFKFQLPSLEPRSEKQRFKALFKCVLNSFPFCLRSFGSATALRTLCCTVHEGAPIPEESVVLRKLS